MVYKVAKEGERKTVNTEKIKGQGSDCLVK